MTLETFFDKFELFADAPDAVAKLRELVLELAVRGQLSERKAEDANDPAWLAFLAEFDNRIYGSDPGLPPRFAIPDEWRWGNIGEIAETCGQKVPDTSFTYIDVGAIDNKRGVIVPEPEVLTPENAPSRARKLVSQGTVIYATVRPYLRNIAIIERDFSPPAIVSTAFAILHPKPFISARFLFYWLRSNAFGTEVAERMKGVAYPAINDSEFRNCPIPLPPLAEQKRIVAKVDELMASCDRLEAQQQERETRHAALARASLSRFAEAPAVANLEFLFHDAYAIPPADLRKFILTLAVQGKLVPQTKKPAYGSLESILAEASVNGVSKGPTSDKSATEILRISAGTSRGDFYVDEADFKHVALPPDEIDKFQLARGDLLACRFNGNLHYVGRFSFYRGESGRVQVNPDKLIRFRIKTDSNCPRYVCLAMNAAPTREAIEAMCATTAGNIGLSAGKLKTVEIPLPPLAEQRRIVAKVDELMALVDALETQLATARSTAAQLLAAAVAELTGTPTTGKGSAPAASGTGRRGRPRKS